MTKIDRLFVSIVGALSLLSAGFLLGQTDIRTDVTSHGGKPALAVIDFRGSGASQSFMAAFNSTLFGDLQSSALFDMRPTDDSVEPIDLRMYLRIEGRPLTETWVYQWTPPSAKERKLAIQ